MSETLDIVALVQNNPLTKLSNTSYDSLIVNKIKEKFNSHDEQLFVANFYCFLNYNTRKDFVVDLDKHWKWLGFGKKSDCKSLLINNFVENEDFVVSKDHENFAAANSAAKKETRGGHNQETILLTVHCFKKLCLKAKTKKSNDIHDYYLNLEELINETIAEQGQDLIKKLKIKDTQVKEQLKSKDKEREQNLILNFKKKQVVYLIVVDSSTIKFGFTKDIETRMSDHRTEFGKDIVLHSVFETIYNREFEQVIKNELKANIIERKYKNNQTELIELTATFTMKDLEQKLETLKENINGDLIANLMKENAELKLKLSMYESDPIRQREIELKEKNFELNKQKLEYALSTTPITPRKDQFVYQVYDPKDLTLIKTYNTIQDAINEKKLYKDAIPQSISRAVRTNRIYKGHRFWRITQTDSVKEYQIPKTEEVDRTAKFEQIVQVSSDNSSIKGIFSCAEDAAIKNLKEDATPDDIRKLKKSITNNLSENGLAYNHRWYRLSEAPEDLVEEYLNTHELPEVSIGKKRVQVHKYSKDGTLIASYRSMTEATKAEKISDTSLKKYITNKTIINGEYFST